MPPEAVGAAFLYVRSGEIVRPDLPDRAALERLLLEEPAAFEVPDEDVSAGR